MERGNEGYSELWAELFGEDVGESTGEHTSIPYDLSKLEALKGKPVKIVRYDRMKLPSVYAIGHYNLSKNDLDEWVDDDVI